MHEDCLYVIFSSDDNYAPYMGTAIYSLVDCNRDFEHIVIYIIDNDIKVDNRVKLNDMVKDIKNVELIWIPFMEYRDKLKLNMMWNISVSAYARLFIAEMIPITVSRIIYMDCDMIVCNSLRELWKTDLSGKIVGVVQDTVGNKPKEELGLSVTEKYFNSGLLLIDLDAWRKDEIGRKCFELLEEYGGKVCHHDQGVLNKILNNKKYILPMKYNTITIHYIFNMRQIRKYYNETAEFYLSEEIENAKKNPVILHFTPSFTSRPWVKGCKHPLKKKFWEALEKTPWLEMKCQKNKTKWYVRIIEWRYRVLPY